MGRHCAMADRGVGRIGERGSGVEWSGEEESASDKGQGDTVVVPWQGRCGSRWNGPDWTEVRPVLGAQSFVWVGQDLFGWTCPLEEKNVCTSKRICCFATHGLCKFVLEKEASLYRKN